RVLGVPEALLQRGGFVFDATTAKTAEDRANPWMMLNQRRSRGEVAAFGEANTVTWMFKSGLGKTVDVKDEKGADPPLFLAGLLHDSIFQSSLLIAEREFLWLYPSHEGYQFFLIEAPRGKEGEVKRVFERALADRGFEVTRTVDRLQQY